MYGRSVMAVRQHITSYQSLTYSSFKSRFFLKLSVDSCNFKVGQLSYRINLLKNVSTKRQKAIKENWRLY